MMPKFTGKVGHSDLEGGFATLESGGVSYKLEGGGADKLKAGTKVEIEGAVDEGGMGIGFGSQVLKVKSFKVL
jgi:hypothetical protein